MPAGLLGPEAARSGDAAANKLFHYIPGTVSAAHAVAGVWERGSARACVPRVPAAQGLPLGPGGFRPP